MAKTAVFMAKVEAAKARQLAENNKRAHPESPPQGSQKKAKGYQDLLEAQLEPAVPENMDIDAFHVPFAQRDHVRAPLRCFAQFSGAPLIGWIKARSGYSVSVQIDAGRTATPRITLIFKSNPEGKANEPLMRALPDDHSFTIHYLPGSRASPKEGNEEGDLPPFSLASFQWRYLKDAPEFTESRKTIWNSISGNDRDHLVEIDLDVEDHVKAGHIHPQAWTQHGKEIYDSFNTLVSGAYSVKLWIRPRTGWGFGKATLRPFVTAVLNREGQHSPYFNEDGTLKPSLDEMVGEKPFIENRERHAARHLKFVRERVNLGRNRRSNGKGQRGQGSKRESSRQEDTTSMDKIPPPPQPYTVKPVKTNAQFKAERKVKQAERQKIKEAEEERMRLQSHVQPYSAEDDDHLAQMQLLNEAWAAETAQGAGEVEMNERENE